MWEKEKKLLLQKIQEISNNKDTTAELDESSAEYKLMDEKNKQLQIIENELQKVTSALNVSKMNETQRAMSPETSIDSEYEALGGWKEMQDLLSAYIPEQQLQQQQQRSNIGNSTGNKKSTQRPPKKKSPLKRGAIVAWSLSPKHHLQTKNNPLKHSRCGRNTCRCRIHAKQKCNHSKHLRANAGNVWRYVACQEATSSRDSHAKDVQDAVDMVQVGDVEFVVDNEDPRIMPTILRG